MSNPKYQNNEGYDVPRVHKGFDKYTSPQLSATQVAAAVRAENEKYPGFLHGLDSKPFRLRSYDEVCPWKWHYLPDNDDPLTRAKRELAIQTAKLKIQRWVFNKDGKIEPYGEPVWPGEINPAWKDATHNISFSGVPTKSEIEEAHVTLEIALRADEYIDALNYASQMVSVLSKQRRPHRSLWQRIIGWFRYQLGI